MGRHQAILVLLAGLTACTAPPTQQQVNDHETRKRLEVLRVCSASQTIWLDPLTGDRYMRTIHGSYPIVEKASATTPLEELCPSPSQRR